MEKTTIAQTTADQVTERILCALLEQPVPLAPSRPRVTQSLSHDVVIWSLRQHLEDLPDDTYSRDELAQRYVQHGAYMAAIAEYRKLLCLDPHSYEARLALADCYLALEWWHEAAQELRLLTLVRSYAQKAWQRLVMFDEQISPPLASLEAAAQQHVWDMLYA